MQLTLTRNGWLNVAKGLRAIGALTLRTSDDENARPLLLPFKLQYRLGRMSEAVDRVCVIIEHDRLRVLVHAAPHEPLDGPAPVNTPRPGALNVAESAKIEAAVVGFLLEELEVDDAWINPIPLSAFGSAVLGRLPHVVDLVRNLGALLVDDAERPNDAPSH